MAEQPSYWLGCGAPAAIRAASFPKNKPGKPDQKSKSPGEPDLKNKSPGRAGAWKYPGG